MADERNVDEVDQEAAIEETAADTQTEAAEECACDANMTDSGEDAGEMEGCSCTDGREEESQEDDFSENGGKEKKSFFPRKKDKKEEAYKAQIDELQDKVVRQMAEFENFRRRTDKEKSAMFETGAKSVIEKILPIVDNFERGLSIVPDENKDDPFVEGMTKIYKQLMTELENLGVKPIEAVGCEFNPDLHNAVMQVENDELESGTVAQELLKGYTYRDGVVRHSMVAVVQ